jgi:hypothetical protein
LQGEEHDPQFLFPFHKTSQELLSIERFIVVINDDQIRVQPLEIGESLVQAGDHADHHHPRFVPVLEQIAQTLPEERVAGGDQHPAAFGLSEPIHQEQLPEFSPFSGPN